MKRSGSRGFSAECSGVERIWGDVVMMLVMMMRAGYLISVLITFIMTLDVLFALFAL